MAGLRGIGRGRHAAPSPQRRAHTTVALIAHDSKKDDLARFLRRHRSMADLFRYLAPEDTARSFEEASLEVEVLAPDTFGGDLQVAAAVVEGRVDAVIFLHDPLAALPSEPSLATMVKVCDLQPIPIATNLACAELIFHQLALMSPLGPHAERPTDDEIERKLVLLTSPGKDDPAFTR